MFRIFWGVCFASAWLMICSAAFAQQSGPETVSIPPNFQLVYTSGPTHASRGGGLRLQLQANGEYLIEKQPYGRDVGPNDYEILHRGRLRPAQMTAVYESLEKNDFWRLAKTYNDPKIIGGGYVDSLWVTAADRQHRVNVVDVSVPKFSAIVNALRQVLPEDHRVF